MKKIIVLISFLSNVIFSREIHMVPYAYYAGQYYCLFLKGPDKRIVSIQDGTNKGENMVERAAKISSLQTKALWGKYNPNHAQFYKRRPSKNDYYESVSFFKEKITEAVEKELVMKTEHYVFIFVEVPYILSDWVQKALALPEAIDSWYAQHQLVWIKIQALFEEKGNSWVVRKRLAGVHGDLDIDLKNGLNNFGIYKFDSLSPLVKMQPALIKVVKHSTANTRREARAGQNTGSNNAIYNSRLRRVRRLSR